MQNEPITIEGFRRLRSEVQRIKAKDRPQVIQAIADARAHGDLKENAEYHAAREKQSLIEARLQYLENLLASARVIDYVKNDSSRVAFGATVRLLDVDSREKRELKIVGKFEADISKGMISIASPLARALLGKQEGYEVVVPLPKGVQTYEILSIKYYEL